MKKILLSALCLSAFVVITGCTTVRDSVPATQIQGSINGKPVSFTGPKDLKAELIEFRVETNGTVIVTVKNIDAKTNPDVITTSGEAQAKITTAQGKAIVDALVAVGALAPK